MCHAGMSDLMTLRAKFRGLSPLLDEATRRAWAAVEARSLGRGGVTLVAEAAGLSRGTVYAGLRELEARRSRAKAGSGGARRLRRQGGGRKPLTHHRPGLVAELEKLVAPSTCGDPMSPLRWTCKSTNELARALSKKGQSVSARTVAGLLRGLEYSLQGNYKTEEGKDHPDRDAQFRYISRQTVAFQKRGQPVISVDTKKKELVGNYKNGGREWRPKKQPQPVKSHDFKDETLGKVIPYGIYDVTANAGWVNVGVDHDTPAFAVASIRSWWQQMGRWAYPDARELLIMADCGESNSYRARLWKTELYRLAREIGLEIAVCHFPPGTSKWNKIEHRMFCHITQNWRARPLVSQDVVVNLIGSTSTTTGLKIRAKLDRRSYPKGVEVADDELARVPLRKAKFHGEWNYTILPI
jgi:transposase